MLKISIINFASWKKHTILHKNTLSNKFENYLNFIFFYQKNNFFL